MNGCKGRREPNPGWFRKVIGKMFTFRDPKEYFTYIHDHISSQQVFLRTRVWKLSDWLRESSAQGIRGSAIKAVDKAVETYHKATELIVRSLQTSLIVCAEVGSESTQGQIGRLACD